MEPGISPIADWSDLRDKHRFRRGDALLQAAYRFLASTLVDPEPDPAVEAARRRIDPLKRRLTEADHYGVDGALIEGGGKP